MVGSDEAGVNGRCAAPRATLCATLSSRQDMWPGRKLHFFIFFSFFFYLLYLSFIFRIFVSKRVGGYILNVCKNMGCQSALIFYDKIDILRKQVVL